MLNISHSLDKSDSMTPDLGQSAQAIRWIDEKLQLLDQRVLPHQVEYLIFNTAKETAAAIASMIVRGAPAIGIAAAYGVVLAARNGENLDAYAWFFNDIYGYLLHD